MEAERRRPPELPGGRSPAVPRGGRQGPSLGALRAGPRRDTAARPWRLTGPRACGRLIVGSLRKRLGSDRGEVPKLQLHTRPQRKT